MRDPRQETNALRHGFKDHINGGKVCIVYHERDGEIPCEPGKDYAEAVRNADRYVKEHYPGRHL